MFGRKPKQYRCGRRPSPLHGILAIVREQKRVSRAQPVAAQAQDVASQADGHRIASVERCAAGVAGCHASTRRCVAGMRPRLSTAGGRWDRLDPSGGDVDSCLGAVVGWESVGLVRG